MIGLEKMPKAKRFSLSVTKQPVSILNHEVLVFLSIIINNMYTFHINWRKGGEFLLRLYTTMMLYIAMDCSNVYISIWMDNGSVVYLSARKSCLIRLDVVHNIGRYYVTGAFFSCLLVSLHSESLKFRMPLNFKTASALLKFRIQLLLLKCVTDILALFSH